MSVAGKSWVTLEKLCSQRTKSPIVISAIHTVVLGHKFAYSISRPALTCLKVADKNPVINDNIRQNVTFLPGFGKPERNKVASANIHLLLSCNSCLKSDNVFCAVILSVINPVTPRVETKILLHVIALSVSLGIINNYRLLTAVAGNCTSGMIRTCIRTILTAGTKIAGISGTKIATRFKDVGPD